MLKLHSSDCVSSPEDHMDSSSPPQKKKKKLDSSHPAEAGRRSTTPTDIKTLVCVAHYIPQ